MAGNPLGAAAPTSPKDDTSRPFYRVPASTRTRRLHGVCLAGDLLLSIYSSRQAGTDLAVMLAGQRGAAERVCNMPAESARALARALEQAANAAELASEQIRG